MTTTPPDEFDALTLLTKALEPFKPEDQNRMLRSLQKNSIFTSCLQLLQGAARPASPL